MKGYERLEILLVKATVKVKELKRQGMSNKSIRKYLATITDNKTIEMIMVTI